MTTQSASSAASNAAYPPDLRTVAEQEFLRLLKRDHPGVSIDINHTWLTSYMLKSLTIPPFTQLPVQDHPTIERSLRQFRYSEPVRATLLDHALGRKSFDLSAHAGFYKAADTVAGSDEIAHLECQHILDLYKHFNIALEPAYRQQLADYWSYLDKGISRRERFITERKKALRLESEAAVEQNLLTISQHAMLEDQLNRPRTADGDNVQKYGAFQLSLIDGQGEVHIFPGAFVLTHTHSLVPPALNDSSLGEVLLRTEHQGLEGFANIAAMVHSLEMRFSDAIQKQVVLQNLTAASRAKVLTFPTKAPMWRLSVMHGEVLQVLFDQQLARQQADFSYLLGQAKALKTDADQFARTLPQRLAQAAHLDNALMLDRNDHRLIAGNMPHWWSTVSHEHQQRWVAAAQDYSKSIIQLHHLCKNIPDGPQPQGTHQIAWLENVRSLAIAQLRMDQVQAQADPLPDAARAWMKVIIDNPCVETRQQVDGKTINLDFMILEQHPIPDVMRIAPQGSTADHPMLLCTLNAPDSRVFRWYPNEKAMREQFLDHPDFTRYLLRQLPEESRPVECSAEEYEQWLKHFRAQETYKHLKAPAKLPSFIFGEPDYIDEGEDYLMTHHDLKHTRRHELHFRPEVIKKHGSLFGSIALNIAMLFIPSPVLIALAAGVGLFKLWEAFQHLREGDYHGAAFELLCAVGYLGAAALGRWVINREPFTPLEDLRSATPLVQRTTSEGEEQIGYLESSSPTSQRTDLDAVVPYDANQFHAVQIGEQQYFIKRQPWLFGHCRLYRVDVTNPDLLIAERAYAVESSPGVWSKIETLRTRISSLLLRQSDRELGDVTRDWPSSAEEVSTVSKLAFNRNYLRLAQTSNASELPEILDYCEGGSQPINSLLRARMRTPWTLRFLNEFYCLNEYQGRAYRAALVSAAGLRKLTTEIGQVFVDNGIQSASVSRWSSEQWSRDGFIREAAGSQDSTVFVIFNESVPKKNLFTSFLGDHVAIAPSTPLQLVASRLVGKRFYVYFKSPAAIPEKMFDLYSGNTELML
ncbi:hypothetical protein [Pseudomonas syringae group sp. J309-1]|uniref:hypothetical protein n=1 Tax=Pseudomonas syringae group sp. J309-1 TaxID=3079588 RepID=UPI00290F6955|nr:hypothetical protein [Pseudomonas syringae group sp. J309-1]MDU8358336.1 hypothetical protein [Pseudomonas syringae group sp. J309-1]